MISLIADATAFFAWHGQSGVDRPDCWRRSPLDPAHQPPTVDAPVAGLAVSLLKVHLIGVEPAMRLRSVKIIVVVRKLKVEQRVRDRVDAGTRAAEHRYVGWERR